MQPLRRGRRISNLTSYVELVYKRNPGPGMCPVKGCRRCQGEKKKLCPRHHQQQFRIRHPLKAAYANLKHHARARGKVFALTLAQFTAFVESNTYLDDKGRTKYSLHIDRKDARFGYEFWNIQVLSCSENSNKERRKGFVKYFQEQTIDPENCPF